LVACPQCPSHTAEYFQGIMPKDMPKNTRFAINFFTSIGLGGLTDE
jgi:pre-mRNA-splicing factor CWC22